jgi:pseudouridylate synthase
MQTFLTISEEVKAALAHGQPVLALESTIISHGMPYPQNVETALEIEQIVRSKGAIPATCGIISGRLVAGLSRAEIEYLGKKGHEVAKVSRRDIPYLVSKKMDGATTVAGTMIIAEMAGIRVFATGGIGGVHRGAQQTLDISADLQELAQTKVAVISAGAKAILDLPLTLEYLETMGVPVLGYQTDQFPCFFSRTSGLQVDFRLDTPKEIADFLQVKWDMGLKGGALIGNPVPEAFALDHDAMEAVIADAVRQAEQKGKKGKALTPFLLAAIERMTGGNSLKTNIALVKNNAELGAAIAACMV